MELIDEIIDYLHYHPQSKRADIEAFVGERASKATIKRLLASGIDSGMVVSSGNNRATVYSITPKAHLLRTINLATYYAVPLDQRAVQTTYNFHLIRDELPSIDIFTKEEYAFLAEQERIFRARRPTTTAPRCCCSTSRTTFRRSRGFSSNRSPSR